MKKQIQSVINEANTLVRHHHDMSCHGVCEEIIKLKPRLVRLLNAFDSVDEDDEEWEALDLLLDNANEAVKRASDALESHHGGHTTQL